MKRKYRLRRNSDFQRVRRGGSSNASSIMVLAFLRNQLDYSRFGFVVSKRIGNAVQRNRIKRRMREAIRLRLTDIKPGYDIVFIARKPIVEVSFAAISHTQERLLSSANLLL